MNASKTDALGVMIDRITLDDLVTAYLVWRDVFFRVLNEEAARLQTPSDLVEACTLSADAAARADSWRKLLRFLGPV